MLRLAPAPGAFADAALAVAAVALTAVTVWVQPDPIGTPVAGPSWFLVLFPLLFAAPLAWRRSAPLAALSVSMGALVLQALLTGNSPEGLDLILVLSAQAYSVAAYSDRRRAVLGLGVASSATASTRPRTRTSAPAVPASCGPGPSSSSFLSRRGCSASSSAAGGRSSAVGTT